MDLIYAYEENLTAEELADVFHRSGIRRPVDDLKRLETMLRNSNLTLTARLDGVLIGVARAVTDFSYCCYLSDLAVDQEYQRQGIGRTLIQRIKEDLGEQVTLVLLAAPAARDYYGRVGMEKADNAWVIKRTE